MPLVVPATFSATSGTRPNPPTTKIRSAKSPKMEQKPRENKLFPARTTRSSKGRRSMSADSSDATIRSRSKSPKERSRRFDLRTPANSPSKCLSFSQPCTSADVSSSEDFVDSVDNRLAAKSKGRGKAKKSGRKNPAKFPLPIFVQFRIVEWSNDINESKGKGKGKVFPLWRPPAPFSGAERRQSKIRAENKGNKKSQKKVQTILASL